METKSIDNLLVRLMQSLKIPQQSDSKRQELFNRLLNLLSKDTASQKINLDSLIGFLAERGLIVKIDPRFKKFNTWLGQRNPLNINLSLEEWSLAFEGNLLNIWRALEKDLAIPHWDEFVEDLNELFTEVETLRSGANADYIPVLRDADPEQWGVSVVSIDGQIWQRGDHAAPYSLQSTSKPLNYAIALENLGYNIVHKYVGLEPSGRAFNDHTLLSDNRPYNPSVNSGAMMTAALVASLVPENSPREILNNLILETWLKGSGEFGVIGFSEETFLSERSSADNNLSMAYNLRGRTGLPDGVTLEVMTDLYFMGCSVTATTDAMAAMAATLANGGVNPFTGQEVLKASTVRATLSVMATTGMYDGAGQFFFEIGVPSKSGVSGCLMVVVPNRMGLALFSPRLDAVGNSVRGVEFCRLLGECYRLHCFESLGSGHTACKKDLGGEVFDKGLPRLHQGIALGEELYRFISGIVLDCLVMIALADGKILESEISAVVSAYDIITGSSITHQDINILLRSIDSSSDDQSPQDILFQRFRTAILEKDRLIDDVMRLMMLEAAIRIAYIDLDPSESELKMVRQIGKVLQITPSLVESYLKTESHKIGLTVVV